MAELHHILGSILRDISQARVVSDIYSRNISRYYEQDPLLRRFPTPRTEVEEVEIDLKFVLSGIEIDPVQDESREASTATVFTKISDTITGKFFDSLLDEIGKFYTFSEEMEKGLVPENWREIENRLKGFEERIYLRQALLLYFQRNRGHLIKNGKFQYKEAEREIIEILSKKLPELLVDSGLTDKQLEKLEKDILEAVDLAYNLKSIQEAIEYAWKKRGDYKVAVEVTADKLQATPEAAISTIKIKSTVRNYTWSKVEHEGKKWRALNPE